MNRPSSSVRLIIPLWLLAAVTCLSGVFLVVGLGAVAPVFLETSLIGVAGRLAISVLCFVVFVSAHWHGRQCVRRISA